MIISHVLKCMYIGPAKTGTTLICELLQEKTAEKFNLPSKHFGPDNLDVFKRYPEYTRFMTVRNPYSRMVSLWNHFRNAPVGPIVNQLGNKNEGMSYIKDQAKIKSFVEWIESYENMEERNTIPGYSPWGDNLLDYYSKFDRLDFWLCQENLLEECKKLPFSLNIKPRIENKGKYTKPWQDHYEGREDIINLIKTKYTKDFEMFRYSTDFSSLVEGK